MPKRKVLTSVKDTDLVERRRDQMIQGAITLFKEKGFHRTTTREIAQASGFSIGTLYEYIRKKEDVLFLVCDAIYDRVREKLEPAMNLENPSRESLEKVIRSYYFLMDDMQEEILLLYQEIKGLDKETRKYVLKKEKDMVAMLESVILSCLENEIPRRKAALIANNIFVQGQMWGFRRWILHSHYTIEEYAAEQIELHLRSMTG